MKSKILNIIDKTMSIKSNIKRGKVGITAFFILLSVFTATHGYYQSQLDIDGFDVKSALSNIKDLQSSVDDITDELYLLDNKERDDQGVISDKYRETRQEIVRVITDINNTTNRVGSILKKISVYKKQIFLINKDLKNTRRGIGSTKEYIEDFANFMYKLENELYGHQTTEIDEIKLLLTSDNIPRTLANDHLVKSMLLQFNDLMTNLDDTEDKQITLIKRLNKLKINAKNDVKDYGKQLEKLQQKKNYLIQFMELYKNDKFQSDAEIENLFNSVNDVYTAMAVMVDDIQEESYNVNFDVDDKFEELEELKEEEAKVNKHPIAWPVYPVSDIQTYFDDEDFLLRYGIHHIGLQIKAVQGTPVYSAKDGVVYHVTSNDGIGINRVLIAHEKGYVTTYMYTNSSIVKPGDIVRRGELIGYSGGEPGTRGAGFISKGPNLTFGLFKDGLALDPLKILDLSIVQEKDILPDELHLKYLNDKYARTIDITDIKFMTGTSLLARADTFLNLYGVGIYKQVAFREDAVKDTNIDRDVVSCIAFAESTLGHYLTTSNNIGNVGNDDSGNRIGYTSPLQGARLIADTLNNRHLGHYHTIKQLSRYGNKDGKIYASSPINRQTNVLKCLSQIKGYYIPEDYPFRTGPNPERHEEDLN